MAPLIGGAIADSYGLYATFYFVAVTIVLANLLIFITPGEPEQTADRSLSA